jgi:hypothetical protein
VKIISVPAPPKSAFNPSRRVSDLLAGQLKHFQHVALKHGIKIDPALGRDVGTEGGAARYIAEMTRAIRSQSAIKVSGIAAVPAPQTAVKAKKSKAADAGLAIAAGADSTAAADETSGGSDKP